MNPLPRHKLYRHAVTLCLALGLFVYLSRSFSWTEFREAWSRADLAKLALCYLIGFGTTLIRAWRFAFFFPHTGSLRMLYGCFGLMRLTNMALPFRSGELVFLGILKKLGLTPSISETMPVWVFLRASDLLGLGLLMTFPVSYFTLSEPVSQWGKLLWWLLPSILVSLIGILVIIFKLPTEKLPAYPASLLAAMQKGIHRLRNIPALILTGGLTLLLWAGMGTIVALALQAFEPSPPPVTGFAVGLALLAFSMLPIHTPLGIGTTDAALAFLLHLSGMEQTAAVVLTASVRIILISIVFIDGAIGGLLLLKPRRQALNKPPASSISNE